MAGEGTPLRGAIAAMTRDRVIGVDGKLPWHYAEDLRRFKRRTMGCAVIMGRVTWDSLGRRALPGRRNIVISRGKVAGAEHYHAIATAMQACGDADVWVIGGAQIYRAAMPWLRLLDVTFVPDVVRDAKAVRFPSIADSEWQAQRKTELPGGLVNVIYRRRE